MLFSWPPRSACPIVATTAVRRCLSVQWVLQRYITNEGRVVSTIITQIYLVFSSVRAGDVLDGHDSC